MTKAFLPHLQKQTRQTALVFTTSQLGLVPMLRCPGYGASKAAMHHFVLTLRTQVAAGPGNVKVIEIYPPAVQTELHDTRHQPDLKNGRQMGMPLDAFTDEAWSGLAKGEDQIPVGGTKDAFKSFELKRQEAYQSMTEYLNATLKNFLQ